VVSNTRLRVTDRIRILAPTFLEYLAARSRTSRAEWAGVRLERRTASGPTIVCGLAGALAADLPAGTVVIPRRVALRGGELRTCDESLNAALHEAARHLGCEIVGGDLLTAGRLIVGKEREMWAQRGFVAVDMETGLVPDPVSTVRVVLDSPDADLSAAWDRPLKALFTPSLLTQTARLAIDGPRYAFRSAQIAARALSLLEAT